MPLEVTRPMFILLNYRLIFRIYSGKGEGGQRANRNATCINEGSHAFTSIFVSSNLPLGFTPMSESAVVSGGADSWELRFTSKWARLLSLAL